MLENRAILEYRTNGAREVLGYATTLATGVGVSWGDILTQLNYPKEFWKLLISWRKPLAIHISPLDQSNSPKPIRVSNCIILMSSNWEDPSQSTWVNSIWYGYQAILYAFLKNPTSATCLALLQFLLYLILFKINKTKKIIFIGSYIGNGNSKLKI